MSRTCLLVTHLSLVGLASKQYGIYRRLSLLAQTVITMNVKLRIFCVVPNSERATIPGDRAAQIADEIKEHWGFEAEVFVGTLNSPSKLPWVMQQGIGAIRYLWSPLVRSLLDAPSKKLLRELLNSNIDFIVAHRLHIMTAMSPLLSGPKIIFFDLDDLEHLAALRAIPETKSLRNKLFAWLSIPALILAERRAAAKAALTFVCSKTDAIRAGRLLPSRGVFVLPNAITIPSAPAPTSTRPILLMVGIYSYGPNKDAADYFLEKVLPHIIKIRPDAEIWFVGAGADYLKNFDKNLPGVHFLGFVDDLAKVYHEARVVICPIRFGSGTRVKLIEAAAWGKPIVSTTIGAEGLSMSHQEHALFGDTAEEFAQHCLTLLTDSNLCERLGNNARVLAQKTYDRKEIINMLARELIAHVDKAVNEGALHASGQRLFRNNHK